MMTNSDSRRGGAVLADVSKTEIQPAECINFCYFSSFWSNFSISVRFAHLLWADFFVLILILFFSLVSSWRI